MRLRSGLILVALICLCLVVEPLYAQSPTITAEVDRTILSSDESLMLIVIVTGDSDSRPQLPTLDGFQIVGSSSATQISIVNGAMSAEATYSFSLQPTSVGNFVIPPITVEINGQIFNTEPITIEVMQGSTPVQPTPAPAGGAPAPTTLEGQDFFVEAEVDKPRPYLGEQVIYSFRFYQAVNLRGQPSYDAPAFEGFWNQQETEQNTYTTDAANRTYLVTTLRTILFPTVVGSRTIESALLTIPDTFFQDGESLQTQPVAVEVQPLPVPQPDTFSGAVGKLNITASGEPNEVLLNEPLTLRVTLEGQGNVQTFPRPELPELDNWRVFEGTTSTNSQAQDGNLMGTREDEQLLVPTKAGEYTIPAISYTYFDPDTERYETVSTQPISVRVIGTEEEEEPLPSAPSGEPNVLTPVERDIRHIKGVPPVLATARPALTSRLNYWIAWTMPLLLFVVHFLWQRRRQQLGANPILMRRSQAYKKARRILAEAGKQKRDLYTAVYQALTGYLSDKLNQPITGLTQNALSDLLHQKGLDESLTQRVNEILMQSEMGRFAPQQRRGAGTALAKETEKLLGDLERGLL
ncbi:MAG: BatD family protein [Ardenticatenaceae bacterium]